MKYYIMDWYGARRFMQVMQITIRSQVSRIGINNFLIGFFIDSWVRLKVRVRADSCDDDDDAAARESADILHG